jgi:hypothetical protein
MQQIEPPHEKVGDSNYHQIGVIDNMAGIPRQDEDTAGNDHAKDFGERVKKEITVKARQIEAKKHQGPD